MVSFDSNLKILEMLLNTKELLKLKTADPKKPLPIDLEESKLVEVAYRDEIGPKRKAVRILG